jgi:xylulose-5-phosphate/fructose-6-phosphate phosphoketolase
MGFTPAAGLVMSTRTGDLDLDAYGARELSLGRADLSWCLRQPAAARAAALEHVKPRLLGHWGTTPGLNFIYVHLNRVIKARPET